MHRPVPASADTAALLVGQVDDVRRYARRLTRNAADAEDLAQDTLLRAFRARDRFTPGTRIGAWLATICRREFLMRLRSRRARRTDCWTDVSTDDDAAMDDVPGGAGARDDASYAAVAEDLDERLRAAVDDLPPAFREPFCRLALEGWTHVEIAQRLGLPPGTVMSRVHRARTRLRASLGRIE